MYEARCAEVDAFINSHKKLVDFLPPWSERFANHYQSRWGIEDSLGAESAELCLTIERDFVRQSITCLFRGQPVYRLDVAPEEECKQNWHTAHRLGLPSFVCGTHTHGWDENRAYVVEEGFGRLPVRKKVDGRVLGLADALHWAAKDLKIQVEGGQLDFPMPERSLL